MGGRFPNNNHSPNRRIPVFVDDEGIPCAVASLMLQSGDRTLVEAVSRVHNHARIRDVEAGPLLAWLEREGLTKAEAARIQPSYDPALDFGIFVTALFSAFLPLKIVGDVLWRRIVRGRERVATRAAIAITVVVLLTSLGVAVGSAVALQPTGEPYATVYRIALLLSFLVTLLPLELAALWALLHGDPLRGQRWRAASPYLGLLNVGLASFLAIILVPIFVRLLQ